MIQASECHSLKNKGDDTKLINYQLQHYRVERKGETENTNSQTAYQKIENFFKKQKAVRTPNK